MKRMWLKGKEGLTQENDKKAGESGIGVLNGEDD